MQPIHDIVVGKLKRKQGFFNKWRAFIYVKKGIYFQEFKLTSHYDSDEPRRIYDISGARVDDVEGASKPNLTFRLVTRSSEEIIFIAESDEEKKKWVKSLTTTVERTHFMSCAALIAPVRRRQNSFSFTMKKRNLRTISIVECDEKGIITQVDKAMVLMYGYKDDEILGKKVTTLFTEESKPRFNDHLAAYTKDKQSKPSPVRNMNGIRKNKEEFSISLSLDKSGENIRIKILDRSPPMVSHEAAKDEFQTIATLRVDIMEARELGKGKGLPNPYCVILLDGVEKTTTTTKPKTQTPFWGQEYIFEDIKPSNKKVTIMVHTENKAITDPRLGLVEVSIQDLNPSGRPLDKWFPILSVKNDQKSSKGSESNIRMKFALTVETILPYREYQEFLELFLDDKLTCATALAKATNSQLDDVAGTLVNIFAMKNRVTDFVKKLTAVEVEKTDRGSVLFRGNSLGTKVLDLYMKMVGFDFLQETLSPLVEEVYADKESCEVDPSHLEKGADIKKNQKRLINYSSRFYQAIEDSVDKCPPEMKMVFANVRSEVIKKFTEVEKHTSVSGFVFLRFFCPAILNPKMFGIVEEHPTGQAARTLTLIAKVVQNMANLVPDAKEPFMAFLTEFLTNHIVPMTLCVSKFATVDEENTFEFSGVLNQKDLSREMSALHRHCTENKEELTKMIPQEPKLEELFRVLGVLDKKQLEYERKALEHLKNNPIMHRPSISLTEIRE